MREAEDEAVGAVIRFPAAVGAMVKFGSVIVASERLIARTTSGGGSVADRDDPLEGE
jgi:hypothetical protein